PTPRRVLLRAAPDPFHAPRTIPPEHAGPAQRRRRRRGRPRSQSARSGRLRLMRFFLALLVDGALSGIVYALLAVAFVVVYKASRVINFSLGEWVMLGARLTVVGLHQLAWGLGGAAGGACAGMVGFAVVWNRIVLRRLMGKPLIALIMVTLGLGMVMRGG